MITNIIRQPAISLLSKNGNEALSRSQTPPEILVACICHVHTRAGRLPEPTVPHMLPAIRSVARMQSITYVDTKF